MGLAVMAAAILFVVAAIVLYLSDVAHARHMYEARRFDRAYVANRKVRSKHW
jgi:hypothetical protein